MEHSYKYTVAAMLNLESIFDKIFAYAAADILAYGIDRPPVLTTEQRPLLRRMTLDVCAATVFRLIPAVKFADNTSEEIDNFVQLGVTVPEGESPLRFTNYMETLIAIGVMRNIWCGSGTPLAEKYEKSFNDNIKVLRDGVIQIGKPGRICETA